MSGQRNDDNRVGYRETGIHPLGELLMTEQELYDAIETLLPASQIERDDFGQFLIYTGLISDPNDDSKLIDLDAAIHTDTEE